MYTPKVLFLGANGRDTTRLRLSAEVREIRNELETAGASDTIHFIAELAVRPSDLQSLLLKHTPDVIHFSGHGYATDALAETEEWPTDSNADASREFLPSKNAASRTDEVPSEGLLLEDDYGAAVALRPEVLAELLAIIARDKPLRCVVLNACFTAAQAEVIARHVDCVIGTKHAIDDHAAIAFSIAFYRALAYGKSIGTAFDLGRVEIGLSVHVGIRSSRDAGAMPTPLLFHRPGVAPERLFLGNVHPPKPKGRAKVEAESPERKSSAPEQTRKSRAKTITSQKQSAPLVRPLKSVALLDRRLVMDLVRWWKGSSANSVDARCQQSILYALSLYDLVLVDEAFNSSLMAFFQDDELLNESMMVPYRRSAEGIRELAAAIDMVCRTWMNDPSFQLAVSTYGRSIPSSPWGSYGDDLPSGVNYMKQALLFARHYNAAIIPHPDRFRLYRHWFENSAKLAGTEQEQARTVLELPKPVQAAAVVSARRSKLIAGIAPKRARGEPPVRLVQYGPTVFPVSAAYAQQPESSALAVHAAFMYEFCTAGSIE